MTITLLTSPSTLTVAEAILEQLRLWNVKRIYGVVGDAVFGLMNALAMQDCALNHKFLDRCFRQVEFISSKELVFA